MGTVEKSSGKENQEGSTLEKRSHTGDKQSLESDSPSFLLLGIVTGNTKKATMMMMPTVMATAPNTFTAKGASTGVAGADMQIL